MIHNLFYFLTNIIIGLAMLSTACAITYGATKRKVQRPALTFLFVAFFLFAGFGRMYMSVQPVTHSDDLGFVLNFVAAAISVAIAIIVWPVTLQALAAPSYNELSDATEKWQQAFNQLQYTQRMFEAFMNAIPGVAFIREQDRRIRYVNRAYEQVVGRSASEVVGTKFDWLPQDAVDEAVGIEKQVLETGKTIEQFTSATMPDGELKEWYILRFPISDERGEHLIGIVAVDMTHQVRQEQMRAQLAALVESSEDAIIGKNLEGIITSWNRGAEHLYGYKGEEVIGQPIAVLVPEHRRSDLPELLEKLRRGETVHQYETQRLHKDGTLHDVSLTISPVFNNDEQPIGAAVVARDISERKQAEQKIAQLNSELQARVEQLAEANADLQVARDQALEASSLKSAFVANISHELRTPLSGILGMSELVLQSESLDHETRSMMQIINDSGIALLGVVNDILDLSKIEAGKITLEYEPFNPGFLVQDATKLLASTAASKGLYLEVVLDQHLPQFVFGDSARIRQVLLNLIGNAVKFTQTGSVSVKSRVENQNDTQATIHFSVSDTGIGISPDEQKYLFMPFAQVDNSSTRRFGGTGLGLTISKRFIEMMNGQIGFESEKGKGSTFWFKIPFDKQRMHQTGTVSPMTVSRAGVEPINVGNRTARKVLVVEDNEVLRELALRQLNTLGVRAEAVGTGKEAIEAALSGKYDVVLMDVNLPDISGNQATEAIRDLENSRGDGHRIPIVAMTAGAMKGDHDRAIEAGMDDYLAKPVSIEQLKAVLEKWLQPARS